MTGFRVFYRVHLSWPDGSGAVTSPGVQFDEERWPPGGYSHELPVSFNDWEPRPDVVPGSRRLYVQCNPGEKLFIADAHIAFRWKEERATGQMGVSGPILGYWPTRLDGELRCYEFHYFEQYRLIVHTMATPWK